MSVPPGAANIQACPATCSTTSMTQLTAASRLPRSKVTQARCVTRTTVASCLFGDHTIWWLVTAPSSEDALELLPSFVAQRSTAVEVREVEIP